MAFHASIRPTATTMPYAGRVGQDPSSRNTLGSPAITLCPTSSVFPPSRISPSACCAHWAGPIPNSLGRLRDRRSNMLSAILHPPCSIVFTFREESPRRAAQCDSSIRSHFGTLAPLSRHTHTIMLPCRPTLNRPRLSLWYLFHQSYSYSGASKHR